MFVGMNGQIVVICMLLLFSCTSCTAPRAAGYDGQGAGSAQGEAANDLDEEFGEFEEFESDHLQPRPRDPLRGYNRAMYHFNDKFFLWIWQPLARGYGFVIPERARISIASAFKNVATPVRLGNSLLQFRFKKAGTEVGRLVVNSTLGIGGLFDPADAWMNMPAPSPEDFGQTLGSHGVGGGFPVVLPLLGPSNLRDALGSIPDILLNPIAYIDRSSLRTGLVAGAYLNRASLHIGEYESLKRDALDPYTFLRDAYQQNRDKLIKE